MAHYAIGDLQGCYDELDALLKQLDFNHGRDTLWLVGDLVNRGPKSLQVIDFVMKNESSVQVVLGNHDLHLLAILYGCGKLKKNDTLEPIIQHKKVNKIRDWLRHQPLMRQNESCVLTHAGLLPQWSIEEAQALANEVAEELLCKKRVKLYFKNMYGNTPDRWTNKLKRMNRLRFITNVFTRMRVLHEDGRLDFDYKGTRENIPKDLHAWFCDEARQNLDKTIVFGHWSALGFVQEHNVIALDTGALWGGELTAVNLDTRERFSQASFQSTTKFTE